MIRFLDLAISLCERVSRRLDRLTEKAREDREFYAGMFAMQFFLWTFIALGIGGGGYGPQAFGAFGVIFIFGGVLLGSWMYPDKVQENPKGITDLLRWMRCKLQPKQK